MSDTLLQPRRTRALVFIQFLLGLGAYLFFAWPYLRRYRLTVPLDPKQRYLFVANHVSLLDTILLGALSWRLNCYPILVLGDKRVWHASWLKRLLSSRIGFLLDRGRLNPNRIEELQTFGQCASDFHLLVFPEGTRGDGLHVAECQPGIYHIAQRARVPIVPVFLRNMQFVSTKTGRFHPIGGLRQIDVLYGRPVPPETYVTMDREAFTDFIRSQLVNLGPLQEPTSRTANAG
jgi:1-acyl-sn-glycerol-3-phosphate acyltransferase